MVDSYYRYLHVFDVTGLPEQAPRQIADIPLADDPKWINFTRDGRFAHVSTGDIVDARTTTDRRAHGELAVLLADRLEGRKADSRVFALWAGVLATVVAGHVDDRRRATRAAIAGGHPLTFSTRCLVCHHRRIKCCHECIRDS